MANGKTIPDRWLRCPRNGEFLIASKFLPFKTPLDEKFRSHISDDSYWEPEDLTAVIREFKIGLVIDLTFTTRFYRPDNINCKYKKLKCRGHGECPNEDQVQDFFKICEDFFKASPNLSIGVHCTHGFNRTGFLICSYLVERLDWDLAAAIQSFSMCRSPGIYKQDYLDTLWKKYDDLSSVPNAPPLPDWCFENDEIDRQSSSQISGEVVDRNSDNMNNDGSKNNLFFPGVNVPLVKQLVHSEQVSSIQKKIQGICNWKGRGFSGMQPVSMNRENLLFLRDRSYKVSWKADGIRYMMYIAGPDQVYMLDRDNIVFSVSNLSFWRRKNLSTHLTNTLVDGELILDKVNGENVLRYLVYDIILFEGISVGQDRFSTRLICIDKELIGTRSELIRSGRIDKSKEPFSVRLKPFYPVEQAGNLLSDKFVSQVSHEVDGLIFQSSDDPYTPGRCLTSLKWKPPELNSVDFRLCLKTIKEIGCPKETVALLYVNYLDTPFSKMRPVTSEVKKLDGKIIECRFDFKVNSWVFMRERTDKSFPNAYSTAEAVCKSIKEPVTKNILLSFIENHRFAVRPQQINSKV